MCDSDNPMVLEKALGCLLKIKEHSRSEFYKSRWSWEQVSANHRLFLITAAVIQ